MSSQVNELQTLVVSKRSFSGNTDIMTYSKFKSLYGSLIKIPAEESEHFDEINNKLHDNKNLADDLVKILNLSL